MAPGEPAYFRPDDECPCVRIKRAALIVRGDTIEDGARVLVKCRIAKGALCAVHLVAQPPRPSRLHRHTGADLTFDPTHRSATRASIPHPRPTENVELDVTFLDDTRISAEVAQSAAAAAAAERASKRSRSTPVTYAVTSRATWRTTTRSPTRETRETARTTISRRARSSSRSPAARTDPPTTKPPSDDPTDGRGRLGLRELGQRERPRGRGGRGLAGDAGFLRFGGDGVRNGRAPRTKRRRRRDGEGRRRRARPPASGPSRIRAIRRRSRVGTPRTVSGRTTYRTAARGSTGARPRCRSLSGPGRCVR